MQAIKLDLKKEIYHICDTRKINPISIGEILQTRNTTIIYFVRRLGCFLTRSISSDLNKNLIPKLNSRTQLVVIASENEGHEDFLDSGFLSNVKITNFYYDPGFSSFSSLDFIRHSKLEVLIETFSPKTFKVTKKAISSGMSADLNGDVNQNGGLLIFSNGEVSYFYKQKKVSEFIKIDEILDKV